MGIYDSLEEMYEECVRFQAHHDVSMSKSASYYGVHPEASRLSRKGYNYIGKEAHDANELYSIRRFLFYLRPATCKRPPTEEERNRGETMYRWLNIICKSEEGSPYYIKGFTVEFGQSIIGDLIQLSSVLGTDISYSDLL